MIEKIKIVAGLIKLSLALLAISAYAEDRVMVVTDPWPPFAIIDDDGKISGTDVDIARAVFEQIGIDFEIQLFPWSRCLKMVEQGKADAILAASMTEKRKQFLSYPAEPVSEGETVFFKRVERSFPATRLNELSSYRAGTINSYSYCDELDNSPLIVNSERVGSLQQNFEKLLLNRIDLVVEVRPVGLSTLEKMGLSYKIDVLEGHSYCESGNFLAFTRQKDYNDLADRFSNALRDFKQSEAYRQILLEYGITPTKPSKHP